MCDVLLGFVLAEMMHMTTRHVACLDLDHFVVRAYLRCFGLYFRNIDELHQWPFMTWFSLSSQVFSSVNLIRGPAVVVVSPRVGLRPAVAAKAATVPWPWLWVGLAAWYLCLPTWDLLATQRPPATCRPFDHFGTLLADWYDPAAWSCLP